MAMVRDKKQEQKWKAAQDINVSVDLFSATKQHLKFLEAVDRNSSWLCQNGPALQKAIQRYTACFIPMLAKHTESLLFEGSLVVPLDCEWIWHCHRLNPIVYKDDCQKSYGKILATKNVVSTTEGTSEKETKNVWEKLYPKEPFVLDPSVTRNDKSEENLTEVGKFTTYDLTSAVQRQSSFFSQVSEPHWKNDIYLEGAIARYKGFLHLVKRNMEMGHHDFLTPTYDVDLIWHTHQRHPDSYNKDLENLLGLAVGHDDTVSDRTKGKKLDVGFTKTINWYADMYGARYRRAGTLYKVLAATTIAEKESVESDEKQKIMEVMLEFVNVKDMPEEHKEKQLFVSFSKTQPDALFKGKKMLAMFSEFEERFANFHCQPYGKFLFELVACSPSSKEVSHSSQTLGSCSISIEGLLLPESGYMTEKWLELTPSPNCESNKPISLRMAISVTPPTHSSHCLCTKAYIGPPSAHTIVGPTSNGKVNPSSISSDSVPFTRVSKLSATGSKASFCTTCIVKPSATGSNPSGCTTCIAKPSVTSSNASGCTTCIAKPSATGSNVGACMVICASKPSATGADDCKTSLHSIPCS